MLLGARGSRIAAALQAANAVGGFPMSLVCDEAGLLLAVAGEGADEHQLAGLTALFDDIVHRGTRDVGFTAIDEVALLDPVWGRCVIRPLSTGEIGRAFLVVRVPAGASWRRHTNQLKREVTDLLAAGVTS